MGDYNNCLQETGAKKLFRLEKSTTLDTDREGWALQLGELVLVLYFQDQLISTYWHLLKAI